MTLQSRREWRLSTRFGVVGIGVLVALISAVAPAVSARIERSETANSFALRVERALLLDEVASTLLVEAGVASGLARLSDAGPDEAAMVATTGLDALFGQIRATLDGNIEALRSLGLEDELSEFQYLSAIRAATDARAINPADVENYFSDRLTTVGRLLRADKSTIELELPGVGSADLQDRYRAAMISGDLARSTARWALAALEVEFLESSEGLVELGFRTEQQRQLIDELELLAVDMSMYGDWDLVRSGTDERTALVAQLSGLPALSGSSLTTMQVLQSSLNEADRFDAVIAISQGLGASVIRDAKAESSVADRQAIAIGIALASVVVIGLLLLLWQVRAIVRPLRRLRQTAELMAAGELEAVQVQAGGPHEIQAVERTLGELAKFLQAVNAHAEQVDADDADAVAEPAGPLADAMTVTISKLRERDQLSRLVIHDQMTGLLNRAGVDDTIESMADASEVGVVFIDLDDFKPVNDTYGHAAGDAVIVRAAERLRSAVRSVDRVGRMGGDEFVILTRETAGMPELVARVVEVIQRPYAIEGVDRIEIGCSAGWAADSGVAPAELLRRADVALYAAKADEIFSIVEWAQSLDSASVTITR